MGKFCFFVFCIVVFSVMVKAQEEEVEEGPVLQTCEEALQYMEFLETSVKNEIEEMIHRSSNRERKKTNLVVLIEKRLEQVMKIREHILKRIKSIRKKKIRICPEQSINQEKKLSQLRVSVMSILLKLVAKDAPTLEHIKEINQDLLNMRERVNVEIMRILMLPQNNPKLLTSNDKCDVCTKLEKVRDSFGLILRCAQNKQIAQEDEKESKKECIDPTLYVTTLIDINDNIDLEIKNLYTSINENHNDETRSKSLLFYKTIRERIDKLITTLLKGRDVELIKRETIRILTKVDSKLKRSLKECQEKCESKVCSSCAAGVIYSTMDQIDNNIDILNNQKDFQKAKKMIQKDLINFIDRITRECDKIFVKKIKFGKIDKCEQEKLDIHREIKDPLWLLVNITIAGEKLDKVAFMFDDMIAQLERYLIGYCDSENISSNLAVEGKQRCEMKEYAQTKEYITKVDELIQEHLFKISNDADQVMVVLGFLKIQEMFDKRLRQLFEDKLVCPGEVRTIKNEYIPILNRCVDEFMDVNFKIEDVIRIDRISCAKDLRSLFEKRIKKLFETELENSFKLSRPYIFSSSFDADAIDFGE